MKVFKFGGASVKDAEAVRNVLRVIAQFPNDELMVVVSAMGKTTTALEVVWKAYCEGQPTDILLDIPLDFHLDLIDRLFNTDHPIRNEVQQEFASLAKKMYLPAETDHDKVYDQIVSLGEMISSKILAAYLQENEMKNSWLDARTIIRTNKSWRNAGVDWDQSMELILKRPDSERISITQGFIGQASDGSTTTLGREGSDFSAAIFAYLLDAESVTIWKDVPGMFNADPNKFDDTVLLPKISYREAIELSYFGASVIHPKTIKPLQNKGIPLFVRSFDQIDAPGSIIDSDGSNDHLVPSFILKPDQLLISITPRDLSFIVESHLSAIFKAFDTAGVKIELMQNSALSFSVCVDDTERSRVLIESLRQEFEVRYNDGLELVTVRHPNEITLSKLLRDRELILEQRSRQTARLVLRYGANMRSG